MKKSTAYIVILIFLILIILSEIFNISRSFPFLTFWRSESAYSDQVPTDPKKSVKVPVIMYHSMLKDPKLQNRYCIDPALFEEDLRYLKKHGYTAIFMSDLIDYVYHGTTLPAKPVVLSFDDGYYNNCLYAYPLLKKYRFKAVISIIGIYTDQFTLSNENNSSYSHLTWPQIRKMYASGLVEFQNHSYDSHHVTSFRNGTMQRKGESLKAYRKYLVKDLSKLQQGLQSALDIVPDTFTYPFGAISPSSEKIIKKMGFKASLSCTEGVNTVKYHDKECLYKLKRLLRPPNISSPDFFVKIK